MTREVVELAAQLVAIDSVNPDLIPGGAGEAEAAQFVARWLERAGLAVDVVETGPGRASVVGVARGRGGGRALMLNGHLDTVGVAGMERPFDPREADGRLHGRGAYDMKGGVAAALLAAADAARLGLRGDVVVAAVADEEVASTGTVAVLERVSADAAIVCEPTELRVVVAHKGFAGFEIEVHGRAAHGSRPDLGVDAIVQMGRVLVELGELDDRLQAGSRHPLLGAGSQHASLIEGGQEFSSYPARCAVTGERRTLPGETVADVERDLRGAVTRSGVEAAVQLHIARDAFEIDPRHDLVRAAVDSSGGEVGAVPFWADSALIAAAGIPTVLFGPTGDGAHAVDEWVDAASLQRCRETYVAVARAICG